MRREHNEIGSTVDPSLKFWFKGEEGRLIDEISGSTIVPNGSSYFYWDSNVGAYLAKTRSRTYSAYCTPVDLDTNQWNHTVYAEIYPYSSGSINMIQVFDIYQVRQSWAAFTYSRLTQNQWNKCAHVYTIVSNNLVERRGYINGILDFNSDMNMDGSGFNKGTGITINQQGNYSSTFGSFYVRNLRFYNRPLTLSEINAI